MWVLSGFIVAIIEVLQLPPRESLRTDVIIEFRYGICRNFFPCVAQGLILW